MGPTKMIEVIEGRRYNTETAALLAGNDYWDGSNWERSGRNTYLYRTPRGAYFVTHLTQWQGERDKLEPITLAEAQELFEALSEKRVTYEEAFPAVTVEEA
jgi:hypothetical protein